MTRLSPLIQIRKELNEIGEPGSFADLLAEHKGPCAIKKNPLHSSGDTLGNTFTDHELMD